MYAPVLPSGEGEEEEEEEEAEEEEEVEDKKEKNKKNGREEVGVSAGMDSKVFPGIFLGRFRRGKSLSLRLKLRS